nr:copia protein [Tanacetum cinerariifolium]
AISTKWFFGNKKDEKGIVIEKKLRLVTQGHTQEEGIDYDEVFAPVARIEAIRFFLAYASFMGFMVYQMDVKGAFLYERIEEESANTLVDMEKTLVKDADGDDVDVHLYRYMIRSLMYLTASRPDIMYACKKQIMVATSTTEAEYVATGSCCGQVLWIQMLDYGLKNPPSKHLVFEEPELDKKELGKLEVGKPRIDKQEVEFDLTSSKDDSWYFLGCS